MCFYVILHKNISGDKKMQEKRVTIKIPFDLWKSIRELQTEGKVITLR